MIVCADDFGLAEDINQAILDLAERGKVDAVSVLVTGPALDRQAALALAGFSPRIKLGLHLGLTAEVRPAAPGPDPVLAPGGRFGGFGRLTALAYSGRLKKEKVGPEIAAQHSLFQDLLGRPPDLLDGHLHVQQLPGVAQAVVGLVLSRPPQARPLVRNTAAPILRILGQKVSVFKTLAIGLPGLAFRRRLLAAGLETNLGFAGIYDYGRWRGFPEYFRRFKAHLETDSGLIMVHPGLEEPWRRLEYETLLAGQGPAERP